MQISINDYPPGSKYATHSVKGEWRWKPVDQKYIDSINAKILSLQKPVVEEEKPAKKKGKRK